MIEQQHQASGDEAVERLARLYLVLSRVNVAIEAAKDPRALLQAACEVVVEVGQFRMSWAGLANAETGAVEPVARAGFDEGYADLVQIQLRGPRSEGPTGQAMLSGVPVVCDDVATDPRMEPWRTDALRRGYRSSIGLPLMVDGSVYGVLTAYADEPNRFDAAAAELLRELGRDVSIGLTTLAGEAGRRRAEAALAASEERFRTSLETLLEPFVLMRAVRDGSGQVVDFVYEFANKAACEYNQMTRDELIGASLLRIFPRHEAAGLIATYARVVDTGEPLVLDDFEYEDSWGGRRAKRLFDIRANKLGDSIAYSWRDVTERRHAERRKAEELERKVRERTAELEVARERAAAVADLTTAAVQATTLRGVAAALLDAVRKSSHAADGAVALIDCDGNLTVLDAFGFADDTIKALEARPVTVLTPLRDAVARGEPLVVATSSDLSRYPGLGDIADEIAVRARVVLPLRAGDETPGGVTLGFDRPRTFDETEIAFFVALANGAAHALERIRLTESERGVRGLLEAVVAQMPVGVSLVASNGAVMYRNDALQAMFGPSQEFAELPEAFHADGRPYDQAEWPASRSLASGEVVVNEEIRIIRPDGSAATVMQTSAPVTDAAGNAVTAVVVTLDISERKAAEALRDAFVGVLSHELRTPVTTIYGGARILATRGERLDKATHDELVADIASEGERLTHLVDDLLVLARAERGVDMTARGAALVQHRLRSVVRALEPAWPSRRFITAIPERVPPVTGDEAYFEQVFRNLIGNAAKYGRSLVEVRVERAGHYVQVIVSDDGPGIEPDAVEHVFELFYRATTARALPGAGIGLFVARRLVEAMGGKLVAGNRPEGGATFTVTLPEFPEHGEE